MIPWGAGNRNCPKSAASACEWRGGLHERRRLICSPSASAIAANFTPGRRGMGRGPCLGSESPPMTGALTSSHVGTMERSTPAQRRQPVTSRAGVMRGADAMCGTHPTPHTKPTPRGVDVEGVGGPAERIAAPDIETRTWPRTCHHAGGCIQ